MSAGAASAGAFLKWMHWKIKNDNTFRGFFIVEQYGGDKNGNTTVEGRCVCVQRKDKTTEDWEVTQITDHQWFKGADVEKIINLKGVKRNGVGESNAGRPKRGTKVFIKGKLQIYTKKGKQQIKFLNLTRFEPRAFYGENKQNTYWKAGDLKCKKYWHGGAGLKK